MNKWDIYHKNGAHCISDKPSRHINFLLKFAKKKSMILEIGCGKGKNLLFLKNNGFDVIGIDISKEPLKKIKQTEVYLCNAEELLFEDESFDLVYSFYTLQFCDIKKVMDEILRVLKAGGYAYLVIILKTNYLHKEKNDSELKNISDEFSNFRIIKEKTFFTINEKDTPNEHNHKILKILLQKKTN